MQKNAAVTGSYGCGVPDGVQPAALEELRPLALYARAERCGSLEPPLGAHVRPVGKTERAATPRRARAEGSAPGLIGNTLAVRT